VLFYVVFNVDFIHNLLSSNYYRDYKIPVSNETNKTANITEFCKSLKDFKLPLENCLRTTDTNIPENIQKLYNKYEVVLRG